MLLFFKKKKKKKRRRRKREIGGAEVQERNEQEDVEEEEQEAKEKRRERERERERERGREREGGRENGICLGDAVFVLVLVSLAVLHFPFFPLNCPQHFIFPRGLSFLPQSESRALKVTVCINLAACQLKLGQYQDVIGICDEVKQMRKIDKKGGKNKKERKEMKKRKE